MKKRMYHIRVTHKELGYYSFYDIEDNDYQAAERKAKVQFSDDFSNGKTPISMLEAFTINNPDVFESIMPFMDEIKANM